MKKKIIIIGSGVSSLVSAILLLKAGHEVTILEQHYVPGGYLHCFKRFGHRFETGGHYLGALDKGLPFWALLKYLDLFHEDDYVSMNPENVDTYFFENHEFSYKVGYDRNIEDLCLLFPDKSKEIEDFFNLVQKACHAFPTYYFKTEYDQSEMLKYLDKSLNDILEEFNFSGHLKEILEGPCVLHGVASRDVSFGIHAILIDSIIRSSHGFKFGGEKLAKRFVEKIKDLGGEVLTKKKVVQINVKERMIENLVCEDGTEYIGSDYLSGIHPKILFSMIDQNLLRPAFKNRLKKIKESAPFVGAYLLLDSNMAKQIKPRTNYYFYPNGINTSFDAESVNHERPVLFISCPERTYNGEGDLPICIHASCTEKDFELWKNPSERKKNEDYEKVKQDLFENLYPYIEKSFPGFKNSILSACYSSPLTNKFYNPSPNGSAYGLYHDYSTTGARALGPATTIKNLFLTGQSTLFPGILGSAISGLRSTGNFIGIKPILRQLEKIRTV